MLNSEASIHAFASRLKSNLQQRSRFHRAFHFVFAAATLVSAWLFAPQVSAAYTNGIYAEFNTSMGSFTCRLDYAVAPKAVANFIGLATGERAWLDTNGFIRTSSFYNSSIFHRVVTNFVVQGGSVNGLPSGGPGYQFQDEFSPSERHDAFGVLSMANSGPDSNGSQFFVTVSPQVSLNDSYTIFGRLYGGSNVVYSMNHVATLNEKPVTDIVLQNVVVRRIGEEAEAFDIHAQGLPVVTNLHLGAVRSGTNVSVTFSNQLNVNNWIYSSTNLRNWNGMNLGIETASPVNNSILSSATLPAQFFRGAQVQYPSALYVPRTITGKKLALNLPGATFEISFTNSTSGTYTNTLGASGNVTFYNWKQDPYQGRLSFGLDDNNQTFMNLNLDYTSDSAGNIEGFVYYFVIPVGPVSGTFSSIP